MNLHNSDFFESRHLGLNHNDEKIMLNKLGFNSIEDFINQVVPKDIQINKQSAANFPKGCSEIEASKEINKIANQINSDVQTVTWPEIRDKLKVIKGSELNLVDRESYSRGQQAIDYVDRVKSYYQLLSAHSCIAPKDQLIFF